MKYPSLHRLTLVSTIGIAVVLSQACGTNSTGSGGAALYQSKGCAGCHGADGEGRVGPALVDLYGSTIAVLDADDNEVEITVDGDYLRQSIVEPDAYTVPGFKTKMPPPNNLTDEQINELVVYIESLSSVPPDVTSASATTVGK